MYIWRIEPLRKQLAEGSLATNDAFKYYLASALFSAVLFEFLSGGPPTDPQFTDILDTVLYFLFLTCGVIWCYRQNGGANGRDFLTRMVPIAWVMWWRLVSIVIPFFALLGVIQYLQTGEFARAGADVPFLVVFMNCLYGGMWWRSGVHMKWVADNAGA